MLKSLIHWLMAVITYYTGLFHLLVKIDRALGPKDRKLTLQFERVRPEADRSDPLNRSVTPEFFERMIRILTQWGPSYSLLFHLDAQGDERYIQPVMERYGLEAKYGAVLPPLYKGSSSTHAQGPERKSRELGGDVGAGQGGGNNVARSGITVHQPWAKNPLGGFSKALFLARLFEVFRSSSSSHPLIQKKIKIVYVIDKMARAGAQRHLVRLLRGLNRQRFEPEVLCLLERGELAGELERLRIPVSSLNLRDLAPLRALPGLFRIAFAIWKRNPDFVHTYLFTANVFAALAARLAGVKRIIASRRDLGDWRSVRRARMEKQGHRFAHVITANANAVREILVKEEDVPEEKVIVIPNGVDVDLEVRGKGHNGNSLFRIGTLANLRQEKRIEDFLQALFILKEKIHPFEARIAGRTLDPLYTRKIEGLIDTYGLRSYVHLLGAVTEPRKFLRELDLFFFTSESEGFSNALLEAMAAGLPVIATRVGAAPEMMEDGVQGILIPQRRPELAAQKVLELYEDPQRRCALGEAARERVLARYTAKEMVRRYEELYQRLSDFQK